MAAQHKNIEIEGAEIFFRNFAGKIETFNPNGYRQFCVSLDGQDPGLIEQMQRDGWNIKFSKVREEGDEPRPYLQVKVSYKVKPPTVIMITSKGRTALDESMIEVLDWVDLGNVDLIVQPSRWSMNGNTGIKGYLKAIYVTIEENRFDRKYADVPEIEFNKPLEIEAGPADYIDEIEGEVVYDD
jgi:hypothetical protein